MIITDATKHSTVVYCTDCNWSVLTSQKLAGLEAANTHERNVHPESKHASVALSKARERLRHAGKH